MKYVIDSHAIIWYFEDYNKLGKEAKTVLIAPYSELYCPSIVLAEILFLSRKRRFAWDFDGMFKVIKNDPRFIFFPLDVDVLLHIPPLLEMHDGIIAATSIFLQKRFEEEVPILTCDRELNSCKEIKTIW